MEEARPFEPQVIRDSLAAIQEVLTADALARIEIAARDRGAWKRARRDPAAFLAEQGVSLPEQLEARFQEPAVRLGGSRWPGRRCFTICRRMGPPPRDPDPTVFRVCVQICFF